MLTVAIVVVVALNIVAIEFILIFISLVPLITISIVTATIFVIILFVLIVITKIVIIPGLKHFIQVHWFIILVFLMVTFEIRNQNLCLKEFSVKFFYLIVLKFFTF